MSWIDTYLLAPLWGAFAAQIVFQVVVDVLAFAVYLAGFLFVNWLRRDNLIGMSAMAVQGLFFTAIFFALRWVVVELLSFKATDTNVLVFWVLFGVSTFLMLPQIPEKFRVAKLRAGFTGTKK